MKELIVLIGPSDIKKTRVAKLLNNSGYYNISLDELISKKFPNKSHRELTLEEIKEAYEELGEKTNELLKIHGVVIDDCFYLDNSFDWFKSKVNNYDEEKVFFFKLDYDLNKVLEKNQLSLNKEKESIITNYNLTYEKSGNYHVKYNPISIDSTSNKAEDIVALIIKHMELRRYQYIINKTKDFHMD